MANKYIRLGYTGAGGGGSSFVKDPVANPAALPSSGNNAGDLRYALSVNQWYKWNGTAWSSWVGDLDPSKAMITDANGLPDSSAVTATELGYVAGVTSGIQSQINTVANKASDLVTLSGVAANSTNLGMFTGTIIPDNSTNKSALQSLETASGLITNVNWTGDYNNGVTYTVGDGVMFNGASFRMTIAIGAAGYNPVAYPANWLQVTDYVSPNDIGLGNVDNTSDVNKPISSATQTALNAKVETSLVGAINGVASLDGTGKVPSTQLPSYVDDILEYANLAAFPVTGETGKIYIALDTNKCYRWSGSAYIEVSQGITDHTLLTNIGTNTHAQIDTFMATTSNVYLETKEPTGFFSRTTSTLSFDNGTRNFSITPTGATFEFWVKGVKYTKTGAQTIQIPALSGNHFIYFDATGALGTTQAAGPELFIDNALISVIYWNTDTNTLTYFAEERHGMEMDGATHSYLHTVFGAQFISGLALQDFSVDGTGNVNSNAQFTADSGTIRDEDIVINISAQAQIPVLYRQGLLWRKKAADAYPVIYSGSAGYTGANGRLPFNEFTGGAWQLTEVPSFDFVLVHLFATNDINNPIVGIQGIASYPTTSSARTNANLEISTLTGLPFAEFVAIGSVIFQTATGYTSATKSRVGSTDTGADYVDFRGTQLYTPAGEASSHGLLSGLSSDDHLQYHNDDRGDIRYYTKAQVDTIISGITSPGDLDDTAFSFANNQTSAANITGFAFNAASVRSFSATVSVAIDATSDLFEAFTITGINRGGSFDIAISSVGDTSGVTLSCTSAGQVQYQTPNYSGFVSGALRFRAITTAI